MRLVVCHAGVLTSPGKAGFQPQVLSGAAKGPIPRAAQEFARKLFKEFPRAIKEGRTP
jgi:hypothetical protein